MTNYHNLQNLDTDKHIKEISYYSELPKNSTVIGKVDLSDNMVDRNAEKYLKTDDKNYIIMPIEDSDNMDEMKGFIPVSSSEKETIYYVAIEKIHRIPIFLLGLLPLSAVFIVALSIAIPTALRPKNNTNENTPIIAESTATPDVLITPNPTSMPTDTPNPLPARENVTTTSPMVTDIPYNTEIPAQKGNAVVEVKHTEEIENTIPPTVTPSISPTVSPASEDKTNTSTPTPTNTPLTSPSASPSPTETPHVHNFVVEENEATCTDLGFYKKYCKDCGYVVADHTCAAMGHALEVTNVSSMTYPGGMEAEYKCKRCGETVADNFDYTAGLYKADGSLLYTYGALEQLFDWNLSTTPVKEQMDAHTELSDGRILVLPSWKYLSKVAEESGETNAIYSKDGTKQSDGKYHLAFSNTALTEVVLPNDTPYLGNWFIEANNIEKIELPDSITEYKGGIYSLENLRYLKVSAGVPTILGTFTACPKVETLIIPNGVTTIQGVAFPMFGTATANGMNVLLPDTLISFGGCFNAAKIRYLNIPGSVKNLTDITSINGLEEIVLGEGIEEIPDYFRPISGLKKITIPSTMKKIGSGAFLDSGLEEIIWNNCNVELGDNVFGRCNLKQLLIPDNTKVITSYIYYNYSKSNTEIVVFPKEMNLFGRMGCPIINILNGEDSGIIGHVIMPDTIHEFVEGSSSNIIWDTLEEIVLPGGDYSSVNSLFQNCDNLTAITFTSEITGLNKNFFRYIPSVTDIYYYGSEESINKLIEKYRQDNPNENPNILFMNATIHYMTGTPPTRESLMKEYGVWDDYQKQFSENDKSIDEDDLSTFDLNPIFPITIQENENGISIVPTDSEHTHTLSIDEKAPTCTEDGYYKVTCSTCGEILADHICHKLGHNMKMIDPGDDTTDIIVHKYQCTRCQYTESSDHEHNWIVKGYENMTYPDGGDEISICTICLAKKADHTDPIPGLYTEAGLLMYNYDDLEDNFGWNLSTTSAKDLMDAHTELSDGRILLLPSWSYLSKVAEESGADCGLIRNDANNNSCFTKSALAKVILPDDCNEFGNWFCASNVTELELPDSITDYGNYSISSAPKLKYLKLSAGVTDLTRFGGVHSDSELETLIIPEGVTNLGNTTFAGNDKLKNVTLPDSLTNIGRSAFAGTNVEYLEIPSSVKNLDSNQNSLAGMSNLKTLVLHDGLETIGSTAFTSLGKLEKINIPNTVTSIGSSIFSGLNNLKNVTLENGLITLGESTFASCKGINEIIIPNSVKNISGSFFAGADNLKLIVLPDEMDSIGGAGMFSCGDNSEELKIIMPTSIKQWKNGAAMCSTKLKEIVLPGNTNYPSGFFNRGCCPSKVVITSAPTSIEKGAFGSLHDADIYYYGSRESLESLNAAAGIDDVFYQTDNNNTVHFMIGTPPSREDQMNGIDYSSLIEDTSVTTLSVSVSDVSSGNIVTVSGGNAN